MRARKKRSKGAKPEKLALENICDLGGDATDCPSCAYFPDYKWSPSRGYCCKAE